MKHVVQDTLFPLGHNEHPRLILVILQQYLVWCKKQLADEITGEVDSKMSGCSYKWMSCNSDVGILTTVLCFQLQTALMIPILINPNTSLRGLIQSYRSAMYYTYYQYCVVHEGLGLCTVALYSGHVCLIVFLDSLNVFVPFLIYS